MILTASESIPEKLAVFDNLIASRNPHPFPVRVSHGWATRHFDEDETVSLENIMGIKTEADETLYRSKRAGDLN